MAVLLLNGGYPTIRCKLFERKPITDDKRPSKSDMTLFPTETPVTRRHGLVSTGTSLIAVLTLNNGIVSPPGWAEDKQEEDNGIVDTIKSLFDPNEKTKSGKVLPKAYLKSAREVVKTLRESMKEDPNDIAKFRRTADAAKESIRDYLSNWKGQQNVAKEESYVALEKAFRSLASFYAKVGPSAPLPEDIKSEILRDLDAAEEFL